MDHVCRLDNLLLIGDSDVFTRQGFWKLAINGGKGENNGLLADAGN